MKTLLSTLIRGIVLGGAFGAKTGALIGYFAENTWIWISYLLMVGLVLGLIVSSAVFLNQFFESKEIQNPIKKSSLEYLRPKRPYWFSR